MKKNLILFFILLRGATSYSQVLDYHENMELIDSVTSTGNPGWFANQRLFLSGLQCDSATVVAGDTSWLETMPINLTGKSFVTLSFSHICKISFFDSALVEVFNGTNWIQLTAADMVAGQPDSAIFAGLGNKFSEAAYLDWQPGQATLPQNSWWKSEFFDLSLLIGNVPNAKVRWKLYDAGAAGNDNRSGWFIDDVQLIAAPCELTPPALTQLSPLLQGTVFFTGPFNLSASLTDASGLDTSSLQLFYSINGGAYDSTSLNLISGNTFTGTIPAVNDSDTVCYYFSASDASPCHNTTVYPVNGCIQLIARSGLSLPFCDGFDFLNFWTDSVSAGSAWQLGSPTSWPSSAHSAPNIWEVALNSNYVDNTVSYLYSPPMDFSGISGASVNFWFFKDCENTWDGARMDFSIDGGLTWNVLGNTGTGSSWYNDAQLNSSQLPAWTGTGTSWVNASHPLSVFDNQPQARLRFVFTSDGVVDDNGFAIDDFCITTPPLVDAAVTAILQPSATPVGQCVPVTITVTNSGMQLLNSLTVTYSAGGSFTTFNPTVNLLPGASTNVSFLPCFVVPAGNYSLCAWVVANGDTNQLNDTLCAQLTGVTTISITDSISFCDNFDGVNYGWIPDLMPFGDSLTHWQLGTPAYGATSSVRSTPNAWDINLTTPYFGDANAVLYSPFFSIASNADPMISFWQNANTESGWDGVRLEYSVDSGFTWNNLGLVNDTSASYWYNDTVICSNQFAWAGNSTGWKFSQYRNLSIFNSQLVRLRFIFCSDFSINRDGFSIDDFCLGRDTVTTDRTELPDANSALVIDAFPNPAANTCKIVYSVSSGSNVRIEIKDVTGRILSYPVDGFVSKGSHSVDVNTSRLTNGIYFYSLRVNGKTITKKLIVSK